MPDRPELDTYSGTKDCRECAYLKHASINRISISGCAHKEFPAELISLLDLKNWPNELAKICELFEGNVR